MPAPENASSWRGQTMVDRRGQTVGTIKEVYRGDAEGPGWALIQMGLFIGRAKLVPLEGASLQGDRLRGNRVVVLHERRVIEQAPELGAKGEPSPEAQEQLSRHYGVSLAPSDPGAVVPSPAEPAASEPNGGEQAAAEPAAAEVSPMDLGGGEPATAEPSADELAAAPPSAGGSATAPESGPPPDDEAPAETYATEPAATHPAGTPDLEDVAHEDRPSTEHEAADERRAVPEPRRSGIRPGRETDEFGRLQPPEEGRLGPEGRE